MNGHPEHDGPMVRALTPCGRTRREFLWEAGGGFVGTALATLLAGDGFLPRPARAAGHGPALESPLAPKAPQFPAKAKATAIVDKSLAHGRTLGLPPLTVAVLDAGGCLVSFKREDGSSLLRPEIAQAKAYGALGMGTGSRVIAMLSAAGASGRRASNSPSQPRRTSSSPTAVSGFGNVTFFRMPSSGDHIQPWPVESDGSDAIMSFPFCSSA